MFVQMEQFLVAFSLPPQLLKQLVADERVVGYRIAAPIVKGGPACAQLLQRAIQEPGKLLPVVENVDVEYEGVGVGYLSDGQGRAVSHHFHQIIGEVPPGEFAILVGRGGVIVHFLNLQRPDTCPRS